MNISSGNIDDGNVRLYERVKKDRGESLQAMGVLSFREIFEKIHPALRRFDGLQMGRENQTDY